MASDEGDEVGHVGVEAVPHSRLRQIVKRAHESFHAHRPQKITELEVLKSRIPSCQPEVQPEQQEYHFSCTNQKNSIEQFRRRTALSVLDQINNFNPRDNKNLHFLRRKV